MQRDVVCLVALDLIERLILAGMVDVAFVIHIFCAHVYDSPANATAFFMLRSRAFLTGSGSE